MSNTLPFVSPKIQVPKWYTCTISPFPYYNGDGKVEYKQVMYAINQPDSAIQNELLHKLRFTTLEGGEIINISNLHLLLCVRQIRPYYQFELLEGPDEIK